MAGLVTSGIGEHVALKVHLLGGDPQQVAEAKAVLELIPEPALELIVAPDASGNGTPYRGDADVVMVMLGNESQDETSLKQMERHNQSDPRPALFALLSDDSPALMKFALRAGADELLFLPLQRGEATRALLKVSESRRRMERRTGGVVCSIVSLAGGAGVTTTAVNLALALHYKLKRRVALVDLDFQAAMLNVAMNLDSDHSILALASMDKSLDSIQLESSLVQHPSGVYVLCAPKRVEDGELIQESTSDTAISLLRQMFDYVIVDCGHQVNGHLVGAWERSDYLFYMVQQSIGSARCAWRFLEVFRRLRIAGIQPQFILGQYQPNYSITAEQVSEALARPLFAKILRDEKAIERVELMGKDLWEVAPNSPLTRNFEELAQQIAEPARAPETKRAATASAISRLVSSIVYRTRGAEG